AISDAILGQGQAQKAGLRLRKLQFPHRAGAEEARRDGLHQLVERLFRSLDLSRIANPNLNELAGGRKTRIANALVAKKPAYVIARGGQALRNELPTIDLQENMGSP